MPTTLRDIINDSPDRNDSEFRLKDLPTFEITGYDWEIAKKAAELRELKYENWGGGVVLGEQSPFDAHFTGTLGEVAVAKLLGLPVESVATVYAECDGGWDLRLERTRIDVKATSTSMEMPELIIPADKELTADQFILAHRISDRRVRVFGMASRKKVLNQEPRRHPGQKLNYVVAARDLQLFLG